MRSLLEYAYDSKLLGKHYHTRACRAIERPRGFEVPIVRLCNAIYRYALEYKLRFDTSVADDYVLGPEVEAIIKATRGLLNGETGDLDCSMIDGYLVDLADCARIELEA